MVVVPRKVENILTASLTVVCLVAITGCKISNLKLFSSFFLNSISPYNLIIARCCCEGGVFKTSITGNAQFSPPGVHI